MGREVTYTKNIQIAKSYDVIVCGGGPTGSAAALAARRAGMSVLLVDIEGQLGGIATSGLVSHWLGGRTDDCTRWVVGGIFKELAEDGTRQGVARLPKPEPEKGFSPHGWNSPKGGQLTAGVPIDPFGMARLYDEKMREAGVEVLLKTNVFEAPVSGDLIDHVLMLNKSGLQAAEAKVYVDATGDADVAERSGCDTVLGREEDRLMTPVTLQVHMDNIDKEALAAYINETKSTRLLPEIEQWQKQGIWKFSWNRFISVLLTDEDTFMINSPRITGIDGTSGESVSEGHRKGRQEICELLEIMRAHIPGCGKARIKTVASQLGVRETRRIVGDFVLTVDDLIEGRDFPDTIGYSAYGWDLPDPIRPSYQPMSEKKIKRRRHLSAIPYRAMVPRPVTNLICPGRMISVEREVLGPLREMAPCMAMGHAAGLAAAQAAGKGKAFREVDSDLLRTDLEAAGAVVDFEE